MVVHSVAISAFPAQKPRPLIWGGVVVEDAEEEIESYGDLRLIKRLVSFPGKVLLWWRSDALLSGFFLSPKK